MTGTAEQAVERSLQLTKQGRLEENHDLLWVAAREHPDNAEIALRLGQALTYRQGMSEAAAEWADQAASLAPQDPVILLQTAAILLRIGKVEQARERLIAAHALADETFPLAVDLVHLAGLVAWKRGELAKAEHGLVAAFEEAPEIPGHATALVRFFEEQGRTADAAQVGRVGLEHFPDDETLKGYAESGGAGH